MVTADPERQTDRRATWLVRRALPVILGGLAFAAVGYLIGSPSRGRSALELAMDERVGPLAVSDVPLQVLVHDLLESGSRRQTIRVCRLLANRPVDMTVGHPEPLRRVLEKIATKVGSRLVFANSQRDNRDLPTILCPDKVGEYIDIG